MVSLSSIHGTRRTRYGNGELYCAGSSKVYRFSSADCTPVASITNGTDTITDCGRGYVNLNCAFSNNYFYNWYADGVLFNSDTSTVQVATAGDYVVEVINGACVNRDTIHVDLVTGLNVTFSGLDTLYCVYNSTAFLFPNILGGTFTGPGISLASFNPSVAGEGTHTIIYTYTDATGCIYADSQVVRVDLCVGVPENKWLNTVSVFPNPSNGDFNLQFFSKTDRHLNMTITNNVGQIVSSEQYVIGAGESSISIDQSLAKGIYFLKFSEGDDVAVKKIVIQ